MLSEKVPKTVWQEFDNATRPGEKMSNIVKVFKRFCGYDLTDLKSDVMPYLDCDMKKRYPKDVFSRNMTNDNILY